MVIGKVITSIINDPLRKIFAIILSFGLWFFVAIDSNYKYERGINIRYTGLAESLIVADAVQSIEVLFSGKGRLLFSVWATPPEVLCNLSDGQLGVNRIPVKELVMPIGTGDISIDYNIKSITVTIDKRVEKILKVSVPIKEQLRQGYSISEISILDTIRAIGPKEVLNNLGEIATESLNVKNRNSSFEQSLRILNPSPTVWVSKDFVLVKVVIDTTAERLFTNLPLKAIYLPTQKVSLVKLNLDTLLIKGPKKKIEMMDKKDIEIKIRLTNLSPGEYNLPAEMTLPDYVRPIYSSPKRFRIRIY